MRSISHRPSSLARPSLIARPSLVAMSLAAALLWPSAQPAAQDVVLFEDVPSVDELNAVLFGTSEEAAAPMKTRAIRFHDEPDPAPPPAPSTGDVASADGAVPTPAPSTPAPPPEGTALGLNILFAYDSTNVLDESIPYLERLGEVLSLPENQEKVVSVIGHTDASGGVAYNQTLSEQRALAVGQYLVDAWQIDPNRLAVEGRGEAQPLGGTDPFDGRNRRVEFYAIE